MKVSHVKVYLCDKARKELKLYCAALDISMSNFINMAIREKIKRDLNKGKT